MKPATPQIPKLLVSVRNAEEVLAALAGGADWIDLKEPNAGPLAAVDRKTALECGEVLAARRPLSAALGELRDWNDSDCAELLAVPEIRVVKLGLAGCADLSAWQQSWLTVAHSATHHGKQLVAVIYADWQCAAAPCPAEILRLAFEANSQYLLIDTFDKSAGSTFDCLTSSELRDILLAAHRASMTTVLAGSITRELVDRVPTTLVDIVALRGAVCRGDRTASIDATLVESFRGSLRASKAESPTRKRSAG